MRTVGSALFANNTHQLRKRVRLAAFTLILLFAVTPSILVSQFGVGFSPILTGSMRPIAQPGDLYITRLVNASTIKVGDIVAVVSSESGARYAHRVHAIIKEEKSFSITTKGDANTSVDSVAFRAGTNQKIARVQVRIPWIGKPLLYLTSAQGRQASLSLIVIGNVLTLIFFLFRKKIISNLVRENVYRDLYVEERRNSEQYREVINNLQLALPNTPTIESK